MKPSLLFWYWWKLLAFCWFPSGLPWHWRCLRREGAWRYLTSHWYFVHVRGVMVLVQGHGFSCLQVVRDHMSCLADHNSPFSCTAPLVCSCPCLLHRLCWAETAFLCTQLQIKSWTLYNKCITECKDINWEAIFLLILNLFKQQNIKPKYFRYLHGALTLLE